MKRLTFILAVFLSTTVSWAGLGRAEEIYFDDSGPEIMAIEQLLNCRVLWQLGSGNWAIGAIGVEAIGNNWGRATLTY